MTTDDYWARCTCSHHRAGTHGPDGYGGCVAPGCVCKVFEARVRPRIRRYQPPPIQIPFRLSGTGPEEKETAPT